MIRSTEPNKPERLPVRLAIRLGERRAKCDDDIARQMPKVAISGRPRYHFHVQIERSNSTNAFCPRRDLQYLFLLARYNRVNFLT